MDEATLFKFGKWIDYGKSHHGGEKFSVKGAWSGSRDPLPIFNFFNISGVDEATLFKFGKWIEYGESHHMGEKFPLKGVWSGSHYPLKNFNPPLKLLEWMKLCSLNLASGSTTASPILG